MRGRKQSHTRPLREREREGECVCVVVVGGVRRLGGGEVCKRLHSDELSSALPVCATRVWRPLETRCTLRQL